MERLLLVPTDFTSVSRAALEHAMRSCEQHGGSIQLLHVYPKMSDLEKAAQELEKEMEWIRKASGGDRVKAVIRQGNVLETIGKVAIEESADMIFMGTHGASGWQKIVGSDAIKVISKAKTPFIVVQEKGVSADGYKNILVPVSLNKESKGKLKAVGELAELFDSTVHLLYQTPKDAGFMRQVELNLKFCKDHLKKNGVKYVIKAANEGDNYNQVTLNYAKEINADLIAIMNTTKDSVFGASIFGKNYVQEILANDLQIPVLILNPVASIISRTSASTY